MVVPESSDRRQMEKISNSDVIERRITSIIYRTFHHNFHIGTFMNLNYILTIYLKIDTNSMIFFRCSTASSPDVFRPGSLENFSISC